MQEMVEVSKLQSQEPDASPQGVSFSFKDVNGNERKVLVQAGPAHFGTILTGNKKVTAETVIVQPFKGCTNLNSVDEIKGKIAIMERGDCMFVDKARRVQKAGAVGAIIIDNVPGSTAPTSPMFSMSGDGTHDVVIPTVFLFAEDASKLLLALSKDPEIEVTLCEYKGGGEGLPQNEEESVFQKLKISVQEFLNKHTGLAFAKTVTVDGFKAFIGIDKIRIIHEAVEGETIPTEKVTNQQWSQIRKGLLRSILHSETKELFVPLNILRIYYQTLSNSAEDLKSPDIVKQTEWLLNELNIEYHRKEDDVLIKAEKNIGVTLVATEGASKEDVEYKKSLEKLNSILETINKIEKNVIDDLSKGSDEKLIFSDKPKSTDKVIITKEQLDASEVKSVDNLKSKKSRASDEL